MVKHIVYRLILCAVMKMVGQAKQQKPRNRTKTKQEPPTAWDSSVLWLIILECFRRYGLYAGRLLAPVEGIPQGMEATAQFV